MFIIDFKVAASKFPSRPAAFYKDEYITYSELDYKSSQIATYLLTRLAGKGLLALLHHPREGHGIGIGRGRQDCRGARRKNLGRKPGRTRFPVPYSADARRRPLKVRALISTRTTVSRRSGSGSVWHGTIANSGY